MLLEWFKSEGVGNSGVATGVQGRHVQIQGYIIMDWRKYGEIPTIRIPIYCILSLSLIHKWCSIDLTSALNLKDVHKTNL